MQISRGHIGVIGTARTVASGTFAMEVAKLGRHRVTAVPAPLLVPIVEEGWENSDIARLAVARYVAKFDEIDTLVLACMHYPLLMQAFEQALGVGVGLLDPSPAVAERLVCWLARHPGYTQEGSGELSMLCTGDPEVFRGHGARFLGVELPAVHHVAEEAGRLAHRDSVRIPSARLCGKRPDDQPGSTNPAMCARSSSGGNLSKMFCSRRSLWRR